MDIYRHIEINLYISNIAIDKTSVNDYCQLVSLLMGHVILQGRPGASCVIWHFNLRHIVLQVAFVGNLRGGTLRIFLHKAHIFLKRPFPSRPLSDFGNLFCPRRKSWLNIRVDIWRTTPSSCTTKELFVRKKRIVAYWLCNENCLMNVITSQTKHLEVINILLTSLTLH